MTVVAPPDMVICERLVMPPAAPAPRDEPDHGHGHLHGRSQDRRRLIAALCVTAAILVAEVIGGLAAHSLALLSDAGHVVVDLSAQVLALLAITFASRPADARRTYGYYRLEILAALINGVALVLLAPRPRSRPG